MTDRNIYTNRLIRQKSPYLMQHAHNPVDWYPWGPEAFEAARAQDKPIFLSIGYATCHWCHVMERESFESVEVAQLMNDTFINIKVDREELPEVDSLYMEFAQSMMSGAAGWPLNVILTPDLQPFFSATYLPPKSNHGLTGLMELVQRIREVWHGEEREKVMEQAERIVEVFSDNVHLRGELIPEKEEIGELADTLFKMADPVYGGIKGIPKFPIGYQWNFMLHYASMNDDSRPLFLTERTLDMMQRGGIYDHLGGGFSRYSVDEKWLVPHFEKMLYDNALLSHSYLEAWQVTQKPFYRQITEEILDYILRDMTHPDGGFYSAEDADSEGHEGLFYTWTQDEIKEILGEEEGKHFINFYHVTPQGNFDERNILNTPQRLEEFAAKHGLEAQELSELFATQRQILWKVREQRIHPFKDDKILSSWNGLMIFSLAEAGASLDRSDYLKAAVDAANFIRKNMWENGHLLRRWRDNEGLFRAGLDEYAFLIRGLISLFEADQGTGWLEWAMEMTEILNSQFKSEGGAFYQTDGQDQNILLRKTQFSDGAEPSGNSIHCENLLRLYQLTFDNKYLEQAEDIFKAAQQFMLNYSPGYCYHMMNLIRYYDMDAVTAVIALNDEGNYSHELRQLFFHAYLPHRLLAWRHPEDESLKKLIPYMADYKPIDGRTTLYLCHKGVCKKPITELSEMITALHEL
ncbi:MAG TPA: thioredoxin domain-containing protein [Parachlamydiaceae bacterium]|nr:thioredoxin domain-containing protein [Parachlamydiaceae bacterium]